jgi:hypothetical protein
MRFRKRIRFRDTALVLKFYVGRRIKFSIHTEAA